MDSQTASSKARRRWRATLWSMVVIIVLAMALPSIGYVVAQSGNYGSQPTFGDDRDSNPRSDMWRDAREGSGGFTTQTGPYVTNTMISNVGENWRQIRTGPLVDYSGWIILGVLGLVALFYLIKGQVKIEGGRSGMTVVRWKAYERALHWFTAISFILLAITGLSMLFGRYVLIPVFGHSGFSAWAQIAYAVHNYLSPAFSVAVLLMIVLWVRHNIPNRTDIEWFKQGGGIIGRKHPSAGKMNGGEKVWFWAGVFGLGLIVIISGSFLLFPNWGFQTREIMAWSQVVHAIAAMVWICFFFGHAYIGTLGTEGALEGMTRGRVDTNWAKQHHDLWFEDLMAKGERPVSEDDLRREKSGAPAGGAAGSTGH